MTDMTEAARPRGAFAIRRTRPDAVRGLSFTEAVEAAAGLADGAKQKIEPAAVAMGEQIRAARLSRGLTQKQLADRAGITQGVLSEIERGGGRDGPSYRTLHTLSIALDTDLQIGPVIGEPVIVHGAERDIEHSTADFTSCVGLLSSGEWEFLRSYVSDKVTGPADGIESWGRCMVLTMGPRAGVQLVRSAGQAVVVAPLRGAGKFTFHKPLHRRHDTHGLIIGHPVGILGLDSSVTIEPGPEVTSVMMIAAGALVASDEGEVV